MWMCNRDNYGVYNRTLEPPDVRGHVARTAGEPVAGGLDGRNIKAAAAAAAAVGLF